MWPAHDMGPTVKFSITMSTVCTVTVCLPYARHRAKSLDLILSNLSNSHLRGYYYLPVLKVRKASLREDSDLTPVSAPSPGPHPPRPHSPARLAAEPAV